MHLLAQPGVGKCNSDRLSLNWCIGIRFKCIYGVLLNTATDILNNFDKFKELFVLKLSLTYIVKKLRGIIIHVLWHRSMRCCSMFLREFHCYFDRDRGGDIQGRLGQYRDCLCRDTQWARAQTAKFMGPTWGPPGFCRSQMGPMLAPWTLLSGISAAMISIMQDKKILVFPDEGFWCLCYFLSKNAVKC